MTPRCTRSVPSHAAWLGNDSSQSEIWTARLRHGRLGRTVNVGPQRVIPSLPDGTSVQLPRRPPQRVSAGAQLRLFLVDDNPLFRHSHSQPPAHLHVGRGEQSAQQHSGSDSSQLSRERAERAAGLGRLATAGAGAGAIERHSEPPPLARRDASSVALTTYKSLDTNGQRWRALAVRDYESRA